MNNTTLRQPYFMAGLALGILNIIPVLYEFPTSTTKTYEWSVLIGLELLFALNLSVVLKVLESTTLLFLETISLDDHRSKSRLIPWIFIGFVHSQYLAQDLEGASYKLITWLSFNNGLEFTHWLLVLPLCFLSIGITYLSSIQLSEKPLIKLKNVSTQRVHTLIFAVSALSTAYLNETILESNYFGIHFWLSTITLHSLLLIFRGHAHPHPHPHPHPHKLSLTYVPYLGTYLALMILIFCLNIPQNIRQEMGRRESSFALKLWGHFGLSSDSKDVDQIVPENKWLDPKFLNTNMRKWHKDMPRKSQQSAPIVILLTIDSLKADWFDKSARSLPQIKTLQRLTDSPSTWFSAKIFSASTSTRFTLGSLIFGRYPSHLKWQRDRATHPSLLKETRPTLWSQLKQGNVSSTYIATDKDIIRDNNGLGRGLSKVIILPPRPDFKVAFSPSVIDHLISELTSAVESDEGALFFSHLLDAHHPFNGGAKVGKNMIQNHLSELAIIDQQISRLLTWIEKNEAHSRIWLLISSDHGQGFGRHHVRTHNGPPYEHQARVPFWVYHQGHQSQPSAVTKEMIQQAWSESYTWSSIDLHPTLLDLYGLPASVHTQGVSWWPYWSMMTSHQTTSATYTQQLTQMTKALHRRPLLSINWYTRSLLRPDSLIKVIEDTRTKTTSLFKLRDDPKEKQNQCTSASSLCQTEQEMLLKLVYTDGQQPIDMTKKR
jgi:hypothetical protein